MNTKRFALAFASGLIFGLGLIASGMSNPAKVKNFLDPLGAWDPSLALVMAGAIGVGLVAYAVARRRSLSWTGERIELPTATHIDAKLLGGGLLFGAGWGIAGLCPGPAVVALSVGFGPALVFVPAMLAGMFLYDFVIAKPRA